MGWSAGSNIFLQGTAWVFISCALMSCQPIDMNEAQNPSAPGGENPTDPEIPTPPPDPILGDILNEDFEGRAQVISSGSLLNSVNAFARVNDGRPVVGWFHGGAGNPYDPSHADSFVSPQFDSSVKVQGQYSARFGIRDLGQSQKSGSFYHYMTPDVPWTQLHSFFYWRFNSEMAQAGAYPALGSFWEGNGAEDLTYLRFVSTGATTAKLQWEDAGAWTKSSTATTYEYQADTWYQVFIHLDTASDQSTLVVRTWMATPYRTRHGPCSLVQEWGLMNSAPFKGIPAPITAPGQHFGLMTSS